ncbi:hypothetical protein EON63_05370 [archaeon]|nr:MAG: hypothetical protein EON63_05370 [archaeon]
MERETKERLNKLVAGFQAYQNDKHIDENADASEQKKGEQDIKYSICQVVKAAQNGSRAEKQEKPFFLVLPLLLHRAFINLYRQPLLITNRMSQGLFYGLILSCFYAPIGDDQNSIQNRIGNLYELTAICFIGMLSCIAIYPIERNVFYREYPDGYYSAYAYILCYFAISIPLLVATSLGIAALICYAVGLAPDASDMMQFTYCIFTFLFVGECLGVIFCSAFIHVGFAVNIMSAVLSFFSIMSGYISLNMPVALTYLSYISPLMWGSFILSNLTFDGETFSCDDADSGICYTTGEEVLDVYNLNKGSGWRSMSFHYYILTMISVLYLFGAVFAVRMRARVLSH